MQVWANLWPTESLVRMDAKTGQLLAVVDLTGLRDDATGSLPGLFDRTGLPDGSSPEYYSAAGPGPDTGAGDTGLDTVASEPSPTGSTRLLPQGQGDAGTTGGSGCVPDVLNGIAWRGPKQPDRVLVGGKCWPTLYEIRVLEGTQGMVRCTLLTTV